MNLKEATASTEAKSHVFNTLALPSCYIIYHEGVNWLFNIHTGWDKRKPYKGHTAGLSLCTWTTAAPFALPFKVRLLPIDVEHILMSYAEVIRRYG